MDRRLASLILLGACGGDDAAVTPDAMPVAAAVARFDPPDAGDGAAWGQVPWPSDHYLGDDGKLKLRSLPVGADADPDGVAMLTESLASMNGPGLRSSAYFAIELATGADVDPGTLAGAAVILDLATAEAVAATARWRPDLGMISVNPALGTILLPGHAYGAYLTSAIRTTDGDALAADPRFDRAADELAPLLDALPEATADAIVVATVFTTSTFAVQTQRMRDVVAASPPTITIDATYGPGAVALATIAGTQTADALPGGCKMGGRAQPINHIAAMVHGTIQLPSFLSAEVNVDGFPEYDIGGMPLVAGTLPVPFSLTLPVTANASWADLPVVIYVHGIGRARHDFLSQANTAARIGAAMIAIDLPYHGSRAAGAIDVRNETLGTGDATTPTPDGFGDLRGLFAATGLFHLGASGGIPGFHPRAMGENLRQAAIELTGLAAFVRDGDDAPLETALGALTGLPATVTFRDDLGLVSESLGGMISGVALAVEPSIGVAFLSSPAAGFPSPAMLHSPNYAALFATSITETYDIADRVDPADPARDYPLDPLVMLFGNVVERGDAMAYAPLVTSGALRGDTRPDVVAAMPWGDVWVSNDTEEGYARALDLPVSTMALASPPEDPIRFAALDSLAWPVSGNRPGGKSGCFVVFHPAGHASIRLVEEEVNYEPEFPPYVAINPPREIADSLVAQYHELYGELLDDHFDGGAVTITDPFADASWFVPGSTCP